MWSSRVSPITDDLLQVIDPDTEPKDIHFLATSPTNGYLAFMAQPAVSIFNFSQHDIDTKRLAFIRFSSMRFFFVHFIRNSMKKTNKLRSRWYIWWIFLHRQRWSASNRPGMVHRGSSRCQPGAGGERALGGRTGIGRRNRNGSATCQRRRRRSLADIIFCCQAAKVRHFTPSRPAYRQLHSTGHQSTTRQLPSKRRTPEIVDQARRVSFRHLTERYKERRHIVVARGGASLSHSDLVRSVRSR